MGVISVSRSRLEMSMSQREWGRTQRSLFGDFLRAFFGVFFRLFVFSNNELDETADGRLNDLWSCGIKVHDGAHGTCEDENENSSNELP